MVTPWSSMPSNHMALSATVKNSYYPIGVGGCRGGRDLTGYGATEVWDSRWRGWCMDLYLQQRKDPQHGGHYSSVYSRRGGQRDLVLEAAETEGQYYVKNADRDNYLFWDDEYDDWTTPRQRRPPSPSL